MEFIYHIWQYLCEKCAQNQQQTSPSCSKIGTDSQNTKTSLTKITIFPPSDVTFSCNFCFIQSKSLLFAYGVKLEAICQVLKIFNLNALSARYVNSLLMSHRQQKVTTKLTLKYFLC